VTYGIEWRYLPGRKVKHALRHVTDSGAACGVSALPASEWRGTGSQREYETLATLPPCSRCAVLIGGRK